MSRPRGLKRWLQGLALLLLVCALAAAALVWRELRVPALPALAASGVPPDAQQVQRGAYLARVGNCAGCHSARGGVAFAGGASISTPFGGVVAGNLTPHEATGLGRWSADAFWRAMHHGQSRDGRLLTPVFPYTSYTHTTREDSDALYAYLRSLPPVAQVNPPHSLRWPYNTQWALALWRTLHDTPSALAPDPQRSAEWNRGQYLVRGLGHCGECHTPRNALGGLDRAHELEGGLMPTARWYAPSLRDAREAGVAPGTEAQALVLLRDGASDTALANGPMAEVVHQSTQHISPADLAAVVTYLQSQHQPAAAAQPAQPAAPTVQTLGERLYGQHCVDCHGEQGQGARAGTQMAYPALAGNRAVTQTSAVNLVQSILAGGFAPSTPGNPQPFGMPPFRTLLSDAEVAAVASHVRQSWGNQASTVEPLDVQRLR